MKAFPDFPNDITVFPLSGALLLPRTRLPLHIFEPRYLAMIDDALKTDSRLIGMVQPDSRDGLHQIGCAGRITAFSETEDGRYMITLAGVSRFRLQTEVDGFSAYRKFAVEWSDFTTDLGQDEQDAALDRKRFLPLLEKYFKSANLKTDWESLTEADDELLINSLAMLCPFDACDKQALLEAPCLATRRETLEALFQFAVSGGSNDKVLQ